MRDFVEEYTLKNGRRIYVLGEGRLVNLAAAEGHPASVMDMSFANQALARSTWRRTTPSSSNKVYSVPKAIDEEIARLKLEAMGVRSTTSPRRREVSGELARGHLGGSRLR